MLGDVSAATELASVAVTTIELYWVSIKVHSGDECHYGSVLLR